MQSSLVGRNSTSKWIETSRRLHIAYAVEFFGPVSNDKQTWALFGDYVGGVLGPPLSFLSLVAVLFTLALQSRELKLSTQELERSASALKSQNETLQQQNFEASFFQLLRLHNDIINAIDLISKRHDVTRGRDCFRVFVSRLRDQLKADRAGDLDTSLQAYEKFYAGHQHELGHYFRLLYNIVKFVHGSQVKNKRFYTNLVRAQLSSDELRLLFYNCLSSWGSRKFKPLIEEYALLKTLPFDGTPSPALKGAYASSAYVVREED